jgi:hypothetical protein
MKTLSEEQIIEIENKETYIEEKAELLKEYKSYEQNLEYADDEFEESLILDKRNKLAVQIKALGAKIREIESLETEA